jgi:VanZ family protein
MKGTELVMHKNKKKLTLYLLLVPAYLLMIYLFSQQTGDTSNQISKGILKHIAEMLLGLTGNKLTHHTLDTINLLFRKFLHFSEYFILAVLLYSMLENLPLSVKKRLILSILPAIIFSATDEFHQLFVPERTGQIIDVFIDSSGVILGALLMYFFETRKLKA